LIQHEDKKQASHNPHARDAAAASEGARGRKVS